MKIGQKSAENRQNTPLGPFGGFDQKKIYFKKFLLMNISLFWDKTFVARPISDLKKLKFMKMGKKSVENCQYTPLGAFLGVGPK